MLPQAHRLYVSRPLWIRLGQTVMEQGLSIIAVAREAMAHHRARTRRARERAALRYLSPHVLRDIGAGHDVQAAARERETTRASFGEPWRHGL